MATVLGLQSEDLGSPSAFASASWYSGILPKFPYLYERWLLQLQNSEYSICYTFLVFDVAYRNMLGVVRNA